MGNINTDIKFDFNDILITPKRTTKIVSRYKDIDLPLNLPLITAPMDTVVNLDNYRDFINTRITVSLPRTIKLSDYYKHFYLVKSEYILTLPRIEYEDHVIPNVGLQDLDDIFNYDSYNVLNKIPAISIDVANGHMEIILEKYVKPIKKINPNIKIMIGNIANPKTYQYYAESKMIDFIRVGIGNGNGCLTTKQTGVGYPMASLIHETRKIKDSMNLCYCNLPAIVADGGMKEYSDIIKAYGLGADYVMLGSLFNKSLESAGDNYYNGRKISIKRAQTLFDQGKSIQKIFRGMSTKEVQKELGKKNIRTSEGVVQYRNVEYKLNNWLNNFRHYLMSAMSYCDANNLEDFIGGVDFTLITEKAYERFNK